jgi:DHA2 family multidrug resistance protein
MAPAQPAPAAASTHLTGGPLVISGLLLAVANFLVVLDTTIANVSVPNIAGGLAVSPDQGVWVITSYAVAEAISVPLTGWLAKRFGAVRVFVSAMIGFGICSLLCGLAPSLGVLVLFRVMQGLFGGPLMPLSQTLLLRVFPPKLASAATGLWAVTSLLAPILGPILGGVLCDSLGWQSIFYVNVPIALVCAGLVWSLLRSQETPTAKTSIDVVGLGLLALWVGALQIMLDLGEDRDWFQSPLIVGLGLTALLGFAVFLIWELTERDPIVDLKVFRHRGFSAGVATLSLGFGAFFGINVLTPLWLQTNMGYTASWAGYVAAMIGVSAVVSAPVAASLAGKIDPRRLVFLGLAWIALTTVLRSQATSDMTFFQISRLLLLQGFGMPMFFLPLLGLVLASVTPSETANAAGLMSFCRTMSGAVATSLVTTVWSNNATRNHAELSGALHGAQATMDHLAGAGMALGQARGVIEGIVEGQSVLLATNQVLGALAVLFVVAAATIWLAPKPSRAADMTSAH